MSLQFHNNRAILDTALIAYTKAMNIFLVDSIRDKTQTEEEFHRRIIDGLRDDQVPKYEERLTRTRGEPKTAIEIGHIPEIVKYNWDHSIKQALGRRNIYNFSHRIYEIRRGRNTVLAHSLDEVPSEVANRLLILMEESLQQARRFVEAKQIADLRLQLSGTTLTPSKTSVGTRHNKRRRINWVSTADSRPKAPVVPVKAPTTPTQRPNQSQATSRRNSNNDPPTSKVSTSAHNIDRGINKDRHFNTWIIVLILGIVLTLTGSYLSYRFQSVQPVSSQLVGSASNAARSTPTLSAQPGTVSREGTMRTGPGWEFPTRGHIKPGDAPQWVGKSKDNRWYKTASGLWVHVTYIRGEPTDLPVIHATGPSPVPTLTVPNASKEANTSNSGTTAIPYANRDSNLRAGPGTNFPIVGWLLKGEEARPVARTPSGQWVQLSNGDWIAAFLLDNLPQQLPIARSIPTPLPHTSTTSAPVRAQPTITPIPTQSTRRGSTTSNPQIIEFTSLQNPVPVGDFGWLDPVAITITDTQVLSSLDDGTEIVVFTFYVGHVGTSGEPVRIVVSHFDVFNSHSGGIDHGSCGRWNLRIDGFVWFEINKDQWELKQICFRVRSDNEPLILQYEPWPRDSRIFFATPPK